MTQLLGENACVSEPDTPTTDDVHALAMTHRAEGGPVSEKRPAFPGITPRPLIGIKAINRREPTNLGIKFTAFVCRPRIRCRLGSIRFLAHGGSRRTLAT
jgi:hypothetical protein